MRGSAAPLRGGVTSRSSHCSSCSTIHRSRPASGLVRRSPHSRNSAAPAVPKLRETLKADDLWLRVKAAEALNAIGEPAMVAVPEMLRMAAKGPTAEDPRGMEQRFLVKSLFNPRGGLLGKSLDGVDRELLYQAVRSGLHNEDGHARGAFSSVYANLSYDELRPLMPAIHRAILEKSPSGVMFDGQIQSAGLDLFSKHHVSEGIELIADYVRLMKPHGSQKSGAETSGNAQAIRCARAARDPPAGEGDPLF